MALALFLLQNGIGGRVVGFILGGELGVDFFQVVEELLFQGCRFLGLGRREIFGFGEIALQVVEVEVAGFPPIVELVAAGDDGGIGFGFFPMLVVGPVKVEGVAGAGDVAGLVKGREEAAAFDGFGDGFDCGEVADGGENVVADRGLAGDGVGRDAGTGDDKGNADAGFPDGRFAAVKGAVDVSWTLDGEGPVVGGVDDVGVVGGARGVERVEELTDGFVHVGDHGGEGNVGVAGAGGGFFERLSGNGARLQAEMGGVVGDLEVERLVGVGLFLHPVDGARGEAETFFGIVGQVGFLTTISVAGVSIAGVEAVGFGTAALEVPFAEVGGCVFGVGGLE